MQLSNTFLAVLVLGAATRLSLPAQDFFGGGLSARSTAQAGIYVPAPSNVTDALALNPAGLAAIGRPSVNLSISGLQAGGSFENASNSHSPMRRTLGAVPFGAFGMPLGHSRWSVAFGIAPDVLSTANWRYRDTPGTAGVSYGQQSETSKILAYRSSAGVAFSISPKVSVGASVGVVYNSNTLDAPYIFQSQPVLKGLKTLLDLHTTGIGWNSSWGVRAQVTRKVGIGAAYRTKTTILSSGNATGNLNALFAALGVTADPTFAYKAGVKVVLPESALASVVWQVSPRVKLSLQGDWIDWRHSFQQLPVSLTNGTNGFVNNLLQSRSLNDTVPLDWKQQFMVRAGVERLLGENFSMSGGFVHGNNPVPGSTLSPLTAAIMQNGLSTGVGYSHQWYRMDLAYTINLTAQSQVGASALAAGEYSNSRVRVGTQALILSTSFHL